jgi:hypothetical protein
MQNNLPYSIIMFREIRDQSFADMATVYGMADMNQHEKRRMGR